MLQPMRKEIECQDGQSKAFILSKFPAIQGREVLTQYPLTAIPKIGEYKVNEEVMLKLMSFVGVPHPDNDNAPPTMLTTRALVDNHVPDWECLMRLEAAMLEYNCSFFGNGKVLTFFEAIAAKAQALITSTLTGLSQQSSAKS
jgi:hypothetical protein